MRRIAFIGIENADSEVLHGALRRNLGADAEINAFEKDVAAVTVAPFLVPKNKETGKLEGSNSVAYISSEADSDLAKKVGRLSKAGVTVRTGWSDFKPESSEDEIAQWLTTGEWPEPEEDELMALLLGDDDDDEEEANEPVVAHEAVARETAPVVAPVEPPVVAERESVADEDDDDLPAWSAPFVADAVNEPEPEPTYPARRFDSMGANDGESLRRRNRASTLPAPESIDDDEDDDLPLPSFSSTRTSEVVQDESTRDDLPHFGYEDEDDLPAFEKAPAPRDVDARDDEDDELPAFIAAPETFVAEPDHLLLDEEEDDLPTWSPAPKVVEEEAAVPASESYLPPKINEFESAGSNAFMEDEDDDLPVFTAPSTPAPVQETRVGRRAARELPALSEDEDEDDLPAFTPEASAPEEKREAPSYARAPITSDDDSDDFDLPAFNAPVQQERVSQDNRFEPEEEESDSLPALDTASFEATDEAPPLRRSRRDFLRAAESIAAKAQDSDSSDDDGDDLPVFSAEFSVANTEDDDELPAPVRRASVSDDDERGDDLPEFVARAEKAVEPEGEEGEEEETFEFAPKVKTPSYAAPADKRPTWGLPVQRPETPVREEPVKRIAPEEVRYEADNPAEVFAEVAKQRREGEGYTQPVIETDVPDRELKPAPGAATDLRKAPKRVVNQRPAAPIEDDSLSFMSGSETVDDFDPEATPPFMEALTPEKRRAQSTMEQIRREYDSDSVMKSKKGSAVCYYVTGSHGGAGKTTSTWMMANTMAAALKNDPDRPVFLIEGDYENSKLAQRLNLPPEKNSGRLAELYRKLSSDRSLISKQKINMYEMTETIIKESIHVNDHGVHIIAAPYDLTKRDGRFLRIAIQKSVEYAERQGGYVFIDADTLSNDDILDRTLAAKANHVILVSFGDKDHVDDTHRAIHTLTTPSVKAVSNTQSTNGMGIPKDRIKLFFNKTGVERFEDLQRTMRPYLTEGHLPTVQGLNDGGWIGNLTGGDFLNAVTSYASFMNRVSPMDELRPYQQRRPQKATQRSGFMKMFGSRRG